jgi:hypothetical protein
MSGTPMFRDPAPRRVFDGVRFDRKVHFAPDVGGLVFRNCTFAPDPAATTILLINRHGQVLEIEEK